MSETAAVSAKQWRSTTPVGRVSISRAISQWPARLFAMSGLPALIILAGCGGGVVSGGSSNGTFSVTPGTAAIDTNCTGCNAASSGSAFEQFTATLKSGGTANVTWAVSGGDAKSGPGTIDQTSGQYSPPPYLTADSIKVTVTASLASDPSTTASATITITPGFLQPLAPENAALGASGSLSVTGYIAEAGGSTVINFALSSTATGSSGGQGTLATPGCTHVSNQFTQCTVTYTAPTSVSANSSTFIVATVGSSSSKTSTELLLDSAGISSDPSSHQTKWVTPAPLGTSGGDNSDYDTTKNQSGQTVIADCCGGTLGSLIQNSGGTQYILSNNHVLARSDQAATGETIIQPGLIDDNCEPTNGNPAGTETPVGVLTAWLPLSSATVNADAAIAQVNSGAVNTSGAIQELGLPQAGILAAAPPGISSTAGKGESPTLSLTVAKSGRTTGLTCASISAINLSVQVAYFKNCAETTPYLNKTYTNQIGITGNQFSDAGDSGSLVVDAANAEPVGLFFAGGLDQSGNSIGVANPVGTVLSELGAQQSTTYTFVGTTDHPVSCLNYGVGSVNISSATTLSAAQTARALRALTQARMLVSPTRGILGAATGKSMDNPGESTVIVYVDQNSNVSVPQTINGVRTQVIPTTAQAVASGTAPKSALESNSASSIAAGSISEAITAKQQFESNLMKQNPAFFGIGVGQSLDNPKEPALVIYVDRRQVPATLPATINGLRTRYIVMDRLHVTRSYLEGPVHSQGHCMVRSNAATPAAFDPLQDHSLRGLNLQ